MGDAIRAWTVMAVIGLAFVGLMVLVNRRHQRIREERRRRWAAMGYGDTALSGGGAVTGTGCGGGGGGCTATGCSGGGCGGGGCGGGGGG
jgi:hypothetical protein